MGWIEQEVNGEGKKLHGYKFKHILQMHLLDDHPPAVCSDDPLELVKPEIDPSLENVNFGYPNCTNYMGWQPAGSGIPNQADCVYDSTGKVDPVSGTAITCSSKIPNPAGWGIENAHYMNWQRVSSLPSFRKLYARIDESWAVGDKKTIYVANNQDLSSVTMGGQSSEIRKSIVIRTLTPFGVNTDAIGILFTGVGMCCLIMFVTLLVWHAHDPDRIAKIDYLGW